MATQRLVPKCPSPVALDCRYVLPGTKPKNRLANNTPVQLKFHPNPSYGFPKLGHGAIRGRKRSPRAEFTRTSETIWRAELRTFHGATWHRALSGVRFGPFCVLGID